MKYRVFPSSAFFLMSAVSIAGLSLVSAEPASAKGQDPVPFSQEDQPVAKGYKGVQAIFNARCIRCHGEVNPRATLDLRTYKSVMKGEESGPVVKAGDVEKSLLTRTLRGHDAALMPPKRTGVLSEVAIKAIEKWVKDGAKDDAPASTTTTTN